MHIFDLHADTPLRLRREGLSFADRALHISAHDLPSFSRITQVFACFCDSTLSDEDAYTAFFDMRARFFDEISPYRSERFTPILAVEDARLLCGSRERLSALAAANVRILTLLWRGETTIGGAFDTTVGLTPFGKEIARYAASLGILTDASHASISSFYDIAEIAHECNVPFLATHSNSHAICPHPRNLNDEQFKVVRDAGGLVGLCLYPPHLTTATEASSADVIRHLEHWLSIGGENTVSLGTDFDGIEKTPIDLCCQSDLLALADELAHIGYSDSLIQKLFSKNAEVFFGKFNK